MKLTTKKIAAIAIIGAVYTVLTVSLSFMSYGSIQLRISEVMNLLAFFNPIFVPGVILGCFISNLFSPNGPIIDTIFGTLATGISLFLIRRSKSLFVASLWPTIINGIIIGAVILFTAGAGITLGNYITFSASVAVGEFLAMTVIGYSLFKFILMKNTKLMDMIKSL